MVTVQVVEPADIASISLLEPANENARRFHSSTRKEFLRQLRMWAVEEGRPLFIAKEQNRLVALGLVEPHQVLEAHGEEVLLSESHAVHRTSQRLSVGAWYDMAIDPSSGDILAVFDIAPQRVVDLAPASAFPVDIEKLQTVSRSHAEAFFASVQRQPHIPFQYPLNYCMARAHEMCRLIECHFDPNPQDVVVKIWNFGKLVVKTDNTPGCKVSWNYHVAPMVKIDREGPVVIDPALFGQPVTVDMWLRRQSDPKSRYYFTTRDAYDQVKEGLFAEEAQGETEKQLRKAWGYLISQILQDGPLPYRCGAM